jgi:hypothetical protein
VRQNYLEKFKEIYKKEYGKEISDEDALEQGTKLLRMVELVYKPMTAEDYKKYSR